MWRTIGTLAAGLVLLAGCADKVDTRVVERDIRKGVLEQAERSGVDPGDVDVDCPDDLDWRTGEDFHCVVEVGDGSGGRVTVTMESDAGEFTWSVD